MPGRETTVAAIPSDNAAFEEGPAVATAVLHRGIEANLPKLRRYARSRTRDAVAADDLVRECVTRALAKLHLWRAGTDLRAWLFTILHHRYVSQLRRATLEGSTVEWSDCASALTCAPQQIERLELRDLERGIMSLSDEQRTAVLLLGLTPANYKEVASACGVPVNTDPLSGFAWPYDFAKAHGYCPFAAFSRVETLATHRGRNSGSRKGPSC